MTALTQIEGSSNVRAVGYDSATKTLTVQFTSGTYDYQDVPAAKWDAIQSAIAEERSVGSVISSQVVREHKHTKHPQEKTGG